MKKLALALVIGILSTGTVLADAKDTAMQNNQQQEDDQLYGYRPVEASKSTLVETSGSKNNQQQEDDAVYGYRPATSSKGEPEAAKVGAKRKNTQQEDDKIYGYRN